MSIFHKTVKGLPIEKASEYYRARVVDPGEFKEGSFRTINITTGIKSVVGKLKGKNSLTAQNYMFDTSKFTVAQAEKWLKDHNIKYKRIDKPEK